MSAKGGITKGKSHKEGGIPMVVKSTGQQVELEGGEGVINKRNMASEKTFEFEGKEKTICEIASEINSADGNGVKIDCGNVTGKKYEYATGGKILDEDQEYSFKEWMDDGNVIEFEKGVYSTQDAQYSNKLKGMDELRRYFKKEFLSDSYEVGGWVLYDEDTEKLIKVFPTESEARKSLYEYEGNANIVEKSNWDKSNKYEGGGNIEWSKAKIGDSARVKSENKMGLIMKDYGRKFHLRFADDTEKTYDASELDFYRFDDEDDALYESGGDVPKSNKMFHLPLEIAVYVPSTQDVDKVISESELNARVDEVSKYLAKIFGGFTKSDKVGGFMASNSELVTEDVVPVVSFATKKDYEANKNKLVTKLSEWARKWGQEAIGFEFEGDLYYVPQKFEGGGDVRDFDWYQGFKKQQLKKGTEHEMEHIDTIKKFKKEGVSDREVAKAIAQDHLDEDENYYIELDKMESERKKLSDAIEEFAKYKSYKTSSKKFAIGGYMGDTKVKVHLLFTEDYNGILRSKNGKFITESNFPKGKVYTFNFLHNDGRTTALEFANTGAYMLVPNEIVNIVGFDESQFGNGGQIRPYQSMNLDSNDKSILMSLQKVTDIYSVPTRLKEKFASFKGDNVVNELSPSMIQKIYGLLFKYHNVENRIVNLYLSNIGVGNILMYAPSFLEKTFISYDESNVYVEIEKEISNIITLGKRANILQSDIDLKDINGIIHVYAKSNPISDELTSILHKSNKEGCVGLGVAEFSSREKLNQFQKTIIENQMMKPKNSNDYLIVNEGITNEANYTLIYVMNKM